MNEVAAAAGVAQSTVSYALGDRYRERGISEGTRQRIVQTACQLGYRPNRLAQAMVTGRNPMFGIVLGQPDTEQVGHMVFGALRESQHWEHSVKLLHFRGTENIQALVNECLELCLAGVVCVHVPQDGVELLAEELHHHMAFAVLDSSFGLTRGIRIVSDERTGLNQALDYLEWHGHQRLAFLSVSGDAASRWREEILCAQMAARGLTANFQVVETEDYWNPTQAEAATIRLLNQPETSRPTALLCAGDALAMVVMRTARQLEFEIPEDLSVIGFSNLTMAGYSDPPLTTIGQPFHAMGERAVQCMHADVLARRNGESAVYREELLDTSLIIRNSCGPNPNRSERKVSHQISPGS